jgi:type VI secretion system protein VasD
MSPESGVSRPGARSVARLDAASRVARTTGWRWPGRRALVGALVVVFAAVTAACGGGKTPPLMRGTIKVDARANPDANGRPSPVVIRVYELKSLAAFNSADFFALFEKETETLGGDLVGREEFQLDPGETRPYQRQLQPDTKFIGVVAGFRDIERARWRESAAVPPKRSVNIVLGLERAAVSVALK